jgi:hypothetical protein
MPERRYRIGLIVNGLEVPKWVRDLADWANAHPTIELAALVVAAPARERFVDRLFRLESKFLCGGSGYRPYARLQAICGCVPLQVEAADLATVADLKLDVLVRCGRATSTEGLADVARDGIVSVFSDGFGEIIAGRAETGFTIERVRRTGETPEALFTGSIATALLYAWNTISLQSRAFQYLRMTLERLASGRAETTAGASPVSTHPSAGALLTYAVRTAQRSFGKTLRRLLRQEFNWQVAVTANPWPDCRFEGATVVPNPPNAFLADPFTITVKGVTYLFVEEFPFDTRKGVISAYRLDGGRAERIGAVLEEPYHLSFPFVFEHNDEIYMVPEGGAGRSVKLYKSTSFPTGWTEVKTLLSDVPAVDTMLFEHDSRWWMLTTIQGVGPGLNNAELHAFHADDPLGEWTPHKRNPIIMDASRGRNGGFVRDREGGPCRVAQVPGFTFYGAGSAVYKIDELTPETYRETLVRAIEPTFFPKLDGTHHIHCAGGSTVFDFMRVERPRRVGSGWLSRLLGRRMDAPRGFEPRLTDSESVVLPLDDGAAQRS